MTIAMHACERNSTRPGRARWFALLAVLAVACAALPACHRKVQPPRATLMVSAAVSLKEPFTEISHRYEALHSDVKVALGLGSSGDLAQQITAGAPVDLIASADEATLDRLTSKGLIRPGSRRDFAGNQLALITRKGELPGLRFATLRDDARIKRFAIGAPDRVPAGRYGFAVLDALKATDALRPRMVLGANVRQVLEWVARGEADAGIVYATDVAISPKVRMADRSDALPAGAAPVIRYPIAVTRAAQHPADAEDFVRFLTGPEGQRILAAHGFRPPPGVAGAEPKAAPAPSTR